MATPEEQTLEASATGMTNFADKRPDVSKNIQTAGLGKEIFGLFGEILNRQSKGGMGTGVSGSDVTTKVPEPSVEGLLKDDETYKGVQKDLSEKVLTPQGQERFAKGGFQAKVAIEPEDDLIDLAKKAADEEVNTVAKKGLRNFRTGLANEGDALDVLEIKNKNLISGDTGLDFNFNNFESGSDVNRVINSISEIYKNPQELEKRGIQTNEETLANASGLLADEIGLTKKLLNKKSGQLLNAEEMTAVRVLLQKSAARLEELAKKVESGDASPNDLVAFRRQMSIHAGIQMKAKGAQTEIARALQSFRIKTGTNIPDVQAQVILDETGGSKLAQKMAKGYLDALRTGGQANANKYVAGAWYQKLGDIWQEVYVNGLLSWAPTHLKNMLATPLFMTYNLYGRYVGS